MQAKRLSLLLVLGLLVAVLVGPGMVAGAGRGPPWSKAS